LATTTTTDPHNILSLENNRKIHQIETLLTPLYDPCTTKGIGKVSLKSKAQSPVPALSLVEVNKKKENRQKLVLNPNLSETVLPDLELYSQLAELYFPFERSCFLG